MDDLQFDTLTRSLVASGSRRRVLVAVLGIGTTLGALSAADAKKKKKKKKKDPPPPAPPPPPPPPPPPSGGPCYATVLPGEDLQAVLFSVAGEFAGSATICLTAGTYVLTGMRPSDESHDLELFGQTLVGAGQDLTVLQGSGVRGVLSSGFGGQLKDLTITGGVLEEGVGGGVVMATDLTMTNCKVTGNTAEDGGGIYIAVLSHLVLDGCTITGNTAHRDPGEGQGGGVFNNETLTRRNTTISGNTSDKGPDCFNEIDATGC